MKEERLPSTAPGPEPSPRPFGSDPRSLRDRWQKLLAENWCECDPKYWEWQPNHRYRFATTDLEMMADLCVTPEERQGVYRLHDDLDMGTLQIARTLRMPYAIAEFLLHERKQLQRMEERQEREWERQEEIEEILVETGVL